MPGKSGGRGAGGPPRPKAAPIARPSLAYQRKIAAREYGLGEEKERREEERKREAEERIRMRDMGMKADLGAAGHYWEKVTETNAKAPAFRGGEPFRGGKAGGGKGSAGRGRGGAMEWDRGSYGGGSGGGTWDNWQGSQSWDRSGGVQGKAPTDRQATAADVDPWTQGDWPVDWNKAPRSDAVQTYAPAASYGQDDWKGWEARNTGGSAPAGGGAAWRNSDPRAVENSRAGRSYTAEEKEQRARERQQEAEERRRAREKAAKGYVDPVVSEEQPAEEPPPGHAEQLDSLMHPSEGLGDSDVAAICRQVKPRWSGDFQLDTIDLSENTLTDNGVRELIQFMQEKRVRCKRLCLQGNKLSEPNLADLLADRKCGLKAGCLGELQISADTLSPESLWRVLEVCCKTHPRPPFRLCLANGNVGRLHEVLPEAQKWKLKSADVQVLDDHEQLDVDIVFVRLPATLD